ncbi:hypothetical protein VTN49DRAFT_873 [Thermomyces lanuginosus]|uniref:uncharacterized protein n=1 Tax=Thermomyces lanuginosus TaxID=5541 RepID=UPI0037429E3C
MIMPSSALFIPTGTFALCTINTRSNSTDLYRGTTSTSSKQKFIRLLSSAQPRTEASKIHPVKGNAKKYQWIQGISCFSNNGPRHG